MVASSPKVVARPPRPPQRLHPLRLGGDMVDWVTLDAAGYAQLPARLEGGTPNVAGAVGLAAAARYLDETGRPA